MLETPTVLAPIPARQDRFVAIAAVSSSIPGTECSAREPEQLGTPLKLASAKSAIDLPLKVLVRQYRNSDVEIAYNNPA